MHYMCPTICTGHASCSYWEEEQLREMHRIDIVADTIIVLTYITELYTEVLNY